MDYPDHKNTCRCDTCFRFWSSKICPNSYMDLKITEANQNYIFKARDEKTYKYIQEAKSYEDMGLLNLRDLCLQKAKNVHKENFHGAS